MGPGWLLRNKLTRPDLMIAAGFSYEVVTAHNGCLQMEVTVHGKMAHAAIPDTGVDALQGAVQILNALYAQNRLYKAITLGGAGHHASLPERRAHRGRDQHQRRPRQGGVQARSPHDSRGEPGRGRGKHPACHCRRGGALPGHQGRDQAPAAGEFDEAPARQPAAGEAIQKHGQALFGEPIPAMGTPLYTDVRLYAEAGIPGVIYGAAPHRAGVACQAGRRAAGAGGLAAGDEGRCAHAARSAWVRCQCRT